VVQVDLVRYGSIAAGLPQVGTLYTQLVEDFFTGRPKRTAEEFATLAGVTTKQVARYFETMEQWGLIRREGSTRARKVVLLEAPNLEFCSAVATAVYGAEVCESTSSGLAPVKGPSHPIADLAVGTLVARFFVHKFCGYSFSLPSEATGKGYVVSAASPDYGHFDYGHGLLYTLYKDIVFINTLSIKEITKQMSLIQEGVDRADVPNTGHVRADVPNPQMTAYPLQLPPGLELPSLPRASTRKSTSAKKRRYETVPENSNGFVYWPNDKLPLDPRYEDVCAVLEYWNKVVGTGEHLNWRLYIPVRECLVEQGLTVDQLRQATDKVPTHDFWADKLTLYGLCTKPHLVREFVGRRNGHDRLVRNSPATPRKDAVAYEF
jgi:hypothetical protein